LRGRERKRERSLTFFLTPKKEGRKESSGKSPGEGEKKKKEGSFPAFGRARNAKRGRVHGAERRKKKKRREGAFSLLTLARGKKKGDLVNAGEG